MARKKGKVPKVFYPTVGDMMKSAFASLDAAESAANLLRVAVRAVRDASSMDDHGKLTGREQAALDEAMQAAEAMHARRAVPLLSSLRTTSNEPWPSKDGVAL